MQGIPGLTSYDIVISHDFVEAKALKASINGTLSAISINTK